MTAILPFRLCRSLNQLARPLRCSATITKLSFSTETESSKFDPQCSRLSGKTAIITGSTDGIGFQIAKRLGAEGANVVVSSRKAENVNRAYGELKDLGQSVLGLTCNVAREDERNNLIEQTVKTFGGIDIFVSSAGINPATGGILETEEKAWDKIFDMNVKNVWQFVQLVVPHMRKKKEGAIVFITSAAGFHSYNTYAIDLGGGEKISLSMGAYAVSKTALHGLTKALSYELSPENIRINSVAPGLINTAFAGFLKENEVIYKKATEIIDLKRIGEPSEVAGMVAFLVSKDGSYVTGESIPCSGGLPTRI